MSPLLPLRVLAALFLAGGTLVCSYSLASRLLPRAPLPLRWSAVTLVGMFFSSLAFHLLLSLGQFKLAPALVALGLWGVAVSRVGVRFSRIPTLLKADARWIARVWKLHRNSPYRWPACGLGLFLLLKGFRILLLPPLGWDALTYHAVKAGLWVQQGHAATFSAPGSWSFYRLYFGGGEIFTAWAMLPFHGDFLVTSVDTLQWVLLGIVLFGLARELRLRADFAWTAVLYILFIPAVHLAIGSNFVEAAFNLSLFISLLFAVRFSRRPDGTLLLLALTGLGLATGIKVTGLFAGLPLLLGLAAVVLRERRSDLIPWFLAGSLSGALMVLPWVAFSLQETGYPLSPLPAELAGIVLGKMNSSLLWYQQLLTVSPYRFGIEFSALRDVFRSPTEVGLHLSLLTLVPMALSIPGMAAVWRRNRVAAFMLAGLILSVFAFYYSPNFSVVRIVFAGFSARFLVPAAAVMVLTSFAALPKKGLPASAYPLLLWAGIATHIAFTGFYGWTAIEQGSVLLFASLLLLAWYLAGSSLKLPPRRSLRAAAILLGLCGLMSGLAIFKERIRYSLARESQVSHFTVKYWSIPAEYLDDPGRPKRIAVTSGPLQRADSWAMYPFMGRRLQNEILYVPISASGEIVDFWPSGRREEAADFPSWLRRLQSAAVTHVMSFYPGSIEMKWMEARPDLFEPLAGQSGLWALFQVNSPARESS